MTGKEREEVFTLLRSYHDVPETTPSTAETGIFFRDLDWMKEKIVGMALNLTRNKGEFTDWAPELNALAKRVGPLESHTTAEKKERLILSTKITQLLKIVSLVNTEEIVVS